MCFSSIYCILQIVVRCHVLMFLFFLFLNGCNSSNIPPGFSKIESIEPPILLDIRYSGSDNFLGRTVVGYENPKNILTTETIKALTKIQNVSEMTVFGFCAPDNE